jgi:multimeric flavodoxin WrbA
MAESDTRHLLVVSHSQTGGTRRLVEAAVAGARADEIEQVEVRWRPALDAGPDDLRWADAVILGTPENFGYMSGGLKDFFDRSYYAVLEETRGLPYALIVKGHHDDGSGATRSVRRITTGLGWKEVQPPLIVIGDVEGEHLQHATELGQTIAAGLELGLW